MLRLVVPSREWYDEKTNEFIVQPKDTTLLLEHSLLSISKWEAKWKKSFLDSSEMLSDEEAIDYVRCMTINSVTNQFVYYSLTNDLKKKIRDYINDPMTATTVRHRKGKPGPKKVITSEVLYSQMVRYGIPFECEKWHLNRLMKLIEVCAVDNGPVDKMSQAEIMKENTAINAMRKHKHKTHG